VELCSQGQAATETVTAAEHALACTQVVIHMNADDT